MKSIHVIVVPCSITRGVGAQGPEFGMHVPFPSTFAGSSCGVAERATALLATIFCRARNARLHFRGVWTHETCRITCSYVELLPLAAGVRDTL